MVERIERAQPSDGTLSLFDLRKDPREQHDLAGNTDSFLALSERVRLLLAKERLAAKGRTPVASPVIDERLQLELKRHGYW